jgi:hypothetical protein
LEDLYDITRILIKIMPSVLILIIGGLVTYFLNSINQRLNWKNHDLAILQEFNKTYYNKETRPLSMLYL